MHKFYINISNEIYVPKVFTLTLPIKNKTNYNKHVIFQLYNMQLQEEVKSNPKTAQL